MIRASIDGFHRPRSERHRRGPQSPEGYYRDSFDHDALRRELVDPLGADGSRTYRTAVFDFRTDSPRSVAPGHATDDAILLLDGVFLLRPELRDAWDLSIFVWVEPEESLRRALNRDVELFGSPEKVERRYRSRYLPGQQLYLEEANPLSAADLLVANDDPSAPKLSGR